MFENQYIFDRKLITEYVISILSKRTILTGLFVFIAGCILYYVEDGNMRYAMLTCAFLGILCAIFLPIVLINSYEKNAKRLNNGTIEKTQVLFNDNIVMNEGKVHLEFEYSQILKITQSKNLVFLELGNKTGILVSKDGFIKGDLNSFLDFINSKINK